MPDELLLSPLGVAVWLDGGWVPWAPWAGDALLDCTTTLGWLPVGSVRLKHIGGGPWLGVVPLELWVVAGTIGIPEPVWLVP